MVVMVVSRAILYITIHQFFIEGYIPAHKVGVYGKKIVLTERIEEGESTTYVYSNYSPSAPRLQVSTSGLWGCHNGSSWVPLPIGQGGTNAATVDGARTNLGLGRNNSPQLNSLFLDRYSDSTNTYTSSGILHTRLLATDSTVRLGADMYVETLSNEQVN